MGGRIRNRGTEVNATETATYILNIYLYSITRQF